MKHMWISGGIHRELNEFHDCKGLIKILGTDYGKIASKQCDLWI